MKPIEKTAQELATELFKIHTHGELCEPDEIVYREEDIIRFLVSLGYPEPDWITLKKQ